MKQEAKRDKNNYINKMDNMRVNDIMTRKVFFVFPETKIREAAALMEEYRVHGLPVVEEEKVVGIVTETDFFVRGLSGFYLPSYIDFIKNIKMTDYVGNNDRKNEKIKKVLNIRVKDIMTKKCITVSSDMTVKKLFEMFNKTKLQVFPVVKKDKTLVGIVTLMDFIKLLKI